MKLVELRDDWPLAVLGLLGWLVVGAGATEAPDLLSRRSDARPSAGPASREAILGLAGGNGRTGGQQLQTDGLSIELRLQSRRVHPLSNSSIGGEISADRLSSAGRLVERTLDKSQAAASGAAQAQANKFKLDFKLNEPRNKSDAQVTATEETKIASSSPVRQELEVTTHQQMLSENESSKLVRPAMGKQVAGEPRRPALARRRRDVRGLVKASVGRRLVIPCANASGPAPQPRPAAGQPARSRQPARAASQQISLIVWHKDEQLDAPIFIVDPRGAGSLREAKQQVEADWLAGRARFTEAADERRPGLVIEPAASQDAGLYHCTVEFLTAPTHYFQVQVAMITPPSNMVIRDEASQRLPNGLAGPYDEDGSLTLHCEAEPGEPSASIGWWRLESVSSVATLPAPAARQPHLRGQPADGAKYLTTVSLERPTDELGVQSENYFVAFQSHEQDSSGLANLPFPNGRQLKRWSRVRPAANSTLSPEGRIVAHLELSGLSKSNLGDEFLCLASNSDDQVPLNSSIKLNLNLKPSGVRITNKPNNVFKVRQKSMLECQVFGSKPSAQVHWFRGSQRLEPTDSASNSVGHDQQDDDDLESTSQVTEFSRDMSNLTKFSYLTFIPRISDHQQTFTCSASNPKMASSQPISDSITLNVHYKAKLRLRFGAIIKEESIAVGSDVFMDCEVRSNPPVDDLSWLFNGQPLAANLSAGVIMSDNSLALQKVRIEHRGKYRCVGRNSMGSSQSNELTLRPKFKPVCDHSSTRSRYEVPINQATQIVCNVLAEPADGLKFTWRFNQSTGDTYGDSNIKEEFVTNYTSSTLTFTPTTSGQLLCSASNSLGPQERPCTISVFAADLPRPVFECFFDNKTHSSFSAYCQTPHMSALSRPKYIMEVYANDPGDGPDDEADDELANSASPSHSKQQDTRGLLSDERPGDSPRGHLVKRVTSDSPSFHASELRPGTLYNLMIYVQNSKGRSPPASYQTETLAPAAGSSGEGSKLYLFDRRHSAEGPWMERLGSYLKMGEFFTAQDSRPIIGIASTILLCAMSVVLVAFLVSRSCRRRQLPASGATRRAKGRRSGDSVAREPRDERLLAAGGSLQLAASKPNGGFLGNGSDTSRETNTDSTLVSSPRTGTGTSNAGQRDSGLSASPQSCASMVVRQQRALAGSLGPTPSPMSLTRCGQLRDDALARAIQVSHVYAQTNKVAPYSVNASNTPQVSIQSGSDCNSNNEQADGSELHEPLLFKYHEPSEPIYMIGRPPSSQQLRLLNADQLAGSWPYADDPNLGQCASFAGGTQVRTAASNFEADTPTSSSTGPTRCQLIGAPAHQLRAEQHMVGSMSIPVSLSELQFNHPQGDQQTGQDLYYDGHHLSGSYMTLANNDHRHQQQVDLSAGQCYYNQQAFKDMELPLGANLDLAQGCQMTYCTLDDADRTSQRHRLNHARRASFDTTGNLAPQHQPPKHRVKFEPAERGDDSFDHNQHKTVGLYL